MSESMILLIALTASGGASVLILTRAALQFLRDRATHRSRARAIGFVPPSRHG